MRTRLCETPDLVRIAKHSYGIDAIPKVGRKWMHFNYNKTNVKSFGILLRRGDCFNPINRNSSTKFLAGLRNDGICEGSKFEHCWVLRTRSFQDDMLIVLGKK